MSSSTLYFLANSKTCLGIKTGNLTNSVSVFSVMFTPCSSTCIIHAFGIKFFDRLVLEPISSMLSFGDSCGECFQN